MSVVRLVCVTAPQLRLIHLAFSPAVAADSAPEYAASRTNRIYALASDLLEDEATNALVVLRMCDRWDVCSGRRVMPLPTQDCACHRIAFVAPDSDPQTHSVLITEMASSKLLQVKVDNLTKMTSLEERRSTDAAGFAVRAHVDLAEEEGDAC